MSLVSIIVPIYNSEKTLNRCINSLICQSFKDIEIILINDGSVDDSLNIIQGYANFDSRIKIINQENKGLSFTRNKGIKNAGSKYILHVDSDDWIEPDMCEIMYNEAEKHDADIVTSHVFLEYPNKQIIQKEPYGNICYFNCFLKIYTTKRGINAIWNKLIKRSLYMLNNIEHYEDVTLGEDSSALLRLIVFSSKIVTINKAFYHYSRNQKSMSGVENIKVSEYIRAIGIVEKFYQNNGFNTDVFPLLRYKIGYKLLRFGYFRKLKKNIYDDYMITYKLFFDEISIITKNNLFSEFLLLDKIFLWFHFIMKVLNIQIHKICLIK